MKKSICISFGLIMVLTINCIAQTTSGVESLKVMQMPVPLTPGDAQADNSIDISFKLTDITNINQVMVTVKNRATGENISTKTLTLSFENNQYYFNYPNRKRLVKRNFIALPEYIGQLNVADIKVEVYTIDKSGKSSTPVENTQP